MRYALFFSGSDGKGAPTMATVIYEARTSDVPAAEATGGDLWLPSAALAGATGWELKPEGICRDEMCIPVPADRAAALVREREDEDWLNLAEFARYMGLPSAHDSSGQIWSFGASPQALQSNLAGLEAPDFTLPDIEGRNHSLSDYRGKKVFLLLWSSW
jgi:hypothetical protein